MKIMSDKLKSETYSDIVFDLEITEANYNECFKENEEKIDFESLDNKNNRKGRGKGLD